MNQFFLSTLEQVDKTQLPEEQAFQVYSESKGSPMVLSLLAPVLAGHSGPRMDSRRWDFYLGKLRLATMN